ncbi:MAG: hypothetical protein WC994_01395 [Brumimicrobium sp.]
MENLDETQFEDKVNTHLSTKTKMNLEKSSGWMKTIAILGIVVSSLGLLGGIFVLFMTPMIGILYLAIYGVFIYISLILLRAATNLENTQFNMESFAENHYKFWKTMVLYMIFAIGISFIAGIIMVSSGASLMRGLDF